MKTMLKSMSMKKTATDIKSKKIIWSDKMIEYSLELLKRYKITCAYSGIDFNGDKPLQYACD